MALHHPEHAFARQHFRAVIAHAERAVAEMREKHLGAAGKPSRSWVDYARWSMSFDWLFAYRGFDSGLKDRIAGELSAHAWD